MSKVQFYGILFREAPDRQGDTIDVVGADLSAVQTCLVGWEFRDINHDGTPDLVVAAITRAYRVDGGDTAEDQALATEAGCRFVKVEGVFLPTPAGRAAADVARAGYLHLGAGGIILETAGIAPRRVLRCVLRQVSVVLVPTDPIQTVRLRK